MYGKAFLLKYLDFSYKRNILKYNISSCRKFSLLKGLNAGEKFTLQLLPEVEKSLENGETKHRKHPGIRNKQPIILPEILKTAIDKILSDEHANTLLKEAEALCKQLHFRRLPVESDEVRRIFNSITPACGDNFHPDNESFGDPLRLSDVLNKRELKIVKKRLYMKLGRWKPIEYNPRECLAYLVGRFAANYASVTHVFQELQLKMPTFKPKSYFDFGSGVGSSLWAAHSQWSDSIKEYFCVDVSPDMNALCESIFTDKADEEKYITPVYFRQFLPASEKMKYDLVVSAFSLLDLPSAAERLRAIDTLWRKTRDILIVVESGTVAGFRCVLDARDYILQVENEDREEYKYYSSGAYVVSPCPHDSGCPKFMEKHNSSCGFLVPYRSPFPERYSQVIKKDWISYVILKKGRRPNDEVPFPRIVKPVLKKNKHVFCRLCCSDGKLHEIIVTRPRHGKHAYRCARTSELGDSLPMKVMPIHPLNDDPSFNDEASLNDNPSLDDEPFIK